MSNPLLAILRTGILTQREMFPDLGADANGLPTLSDQPCQGNACHRCVDACPTQAITLSEGSPVLDRGLCIGCNACVAVCPTGTLAKDHSTRTAVKSRAALILRRPAQPEASAAQGPQPFRRSMHVREVATGDSASDSEVGASTNSVFDLSRFGIAFVASPRFADALLVTGPVPRAMQQPLRDCYDAMAEPRIVIAAGTSAIRGGLHRAGYAEANGVAEILPVAAFIPGDPPHPWSIIHGLLLAMGRP